MISASKALLIIIQNEKKYQLLAQFHTTYNLLAISFCAQLPYLFEIKLWW